MSKTIDNIQNPNFILHHIAFAVKNTDDAIELFKHIYPKVVSYKILEKAQNVFITYLAKEGESHYIELVEPAQTPNPVENLLKSNRSVIYHLCYKVNDFNQGMQYLKEKGYFLITKPFETETEKGCYACHFFSPNIGVIEIVGEKNE